MDDKWVVCWCEVVDGRMIPKEEIGRYESIVSAIRVVRIYGHNTHAVFPAADLKDLSLPRRPD